MNFSQTLPRPRLLIGLILSLAFPGIVRSEIRLPSILGDHMVLQQGNPAVWGWAPAGKTITVSLAGQKVSTKAGTDGKWKVILASLKIGGPYDMVLTGDGAVTVTDILVGDVWLGSGQSNMGFSLKDSHDAATQLPKANFPNLRLFNIDRLTASKAQEDVPGSWKVCAPESAREFSAVAYHFGREIHQALKIPVGLVVSCWGGTPAEDWVPRPALDKEPAFSGILKDWDEDKERSLPWTDGYPYELQISGIRLLPKAGQGKAAEVLLKKNGAGNFGGLWNCSANPGSTGLFEVKGTGPQGGDAAKLSGIMKGGAWITLSTPLREGNSPVDLTSYETLEFYMRGHGPFRVKLGQSSINDYNYYSTDILHAPEDWKLMSFPIRSLKQGEWGTPKAFTQDALFSMVINPEVPYYPEAASVAYNAMIAPLTSLAIRGAFWYQGESNTGRASDYHLLLSTLIRSWRAAWGVEFPFLIVQLPNYMAVKTEPSESSWAELREAQLKTLDIPNTAMVTTIDLGEANNIHPKNKTEVGRRLSLAALGLVYKDPGTHSGPFLEKLAVKDGKMILKFKETGKGLAASDGKSLAGFAVSGEDHDFSWAQAKITGKDTLEVWSDRVKDPVEVRYAWADNPLCNLSNKEGLPASPFRFSTK